MSDFEIRPLKTLDEFHAAEELQRTAWGSADIDIAPLHVMLTIAKNGGVVLGAFAADQLIGFVYGFVGMTNRADAKLKHTSHQMGVRPEWQNRGVGYALKVAQREAVSQQGLRLITWTYDPLESKNARLNITKLGAVCNTYICNYYGELRDDINLGLATDRFQVDWWIASQHVEAHLARPSVLLSTYLDEGVTLWNSVVWNDHDLPMCADPLEPRRPERFLVEFPADFQAVKRADNGLAIAWRLHLRRLCEAAFADGFTVVDYVHEPGQRARSFYVLQKIESSENSLNTWHSERNAVKSKNAPSTAPLRGSAQAA
jgi:predicted GNAT superfamily acetyltransferase